MSTIFDTREKHNNSVISSIGGIFKDVVSVPFNFAADVVKTPFNFVGGVVGGTTTKIVLIAALAVGGLYIVGKYGLLKDVGGLK